MSFIDDLRGVPMVAILRGNYAGRWTALGEALIAGGVTALEVTLNSPGALDAIKTLKAALGERALVGAGTVLSAAEAHAAIDAGAVFIVAPDTDESMISVCTGRDIPVIPGAYTATEIKHAHSLGATLVKLFPVPTVAYVSAMQGPLPHIPLMVTGGVSLENAAAFLKAGASAVGVGGQLTDPSLSDADIAARAAQFVAALKSVDSRQSLPA